MDLLWGFYQVRLEENSIPYMAFATPDGLFEYLVTAMGISSSPSSFNRPRCIFSDYNTFCQTYFDDLFAFTESDSIDNHLDALEKVLDRCAQEHLFIKIEKCVFCQPEIPCLGDYIGRDGIRMDPKKAESIRDWPIPENKRELQSFLGTCVRTREGIAYGGRKLSKPEMVYPTREKELLAALHAMRTWKVYLLDCPSYLNTDHRTLESILQQQTCSQRLARWLNEHCFSHSLSESNIVADAISRRKDWNDSSARSISLSSLIHAISEASASLTPEETLLHIRSHVTDIEQACRDGYHNDQYLGSNMKDLRDSTAGNTRRLRRFSIKNDLLYFQLRPDATWRLCVPDSPGLGTAILFEEHDSPARGHPGHGKTLLLLLEKYYWKRMTQSVGNYIASCESCQRNKSVRGKPSGLLHPLEIPSNRWEKISMDFLSPLPLTKAGYDPFLVVVDRLTKRAHFVATTSKATAASKAQLFFYSYQRLHGLPLSIIPKFTAALWRSIMQLQGTHLQLSTAFKSSTDGQSETTIKFVGEYLPHFVNPHQDNWDGLLPLA
ncbi:Retrotransposon protein, Ty3-gypsy subclass [Phytophthora megakarya]|uniref:Retrotransposon protein, Ty3-gypsy subclass n=1 Tax=Phytophthora megakarya TaxID=4795 RepID=A0A225WWA7_9STRA|nr:Retrotransposon protein, Ty3-gypsy subclass [Phytophthora megakarya]